MAGLEVFHLLDRVYQLVGKGKYLLGVSQHSIAGFGDPESAVTPVEEGDAQEFLQLLHLNGNRRLGDFHCLSCP